MQFKISQLSPKSLLDQSIRLGLCLSSLLFFAGCHGFFSGTTPNEGEVRTATIAGATPSQPLTVVSKKGETLSHIAKKYTGAAKNWTKIAKANPQINPQKLKVGQKISIPDTLVLASLKEPKSDLVLANSSQISSFPREMKRASLKTTSSSISEEELIASPSSEAAPPETSAKLAEGEATLSMQRISQPVSGVSEKTVENAVEKNRPIPSEKAIEKEKLSPKERRQAERAKQAALRSTRTRVISSSGYGSLNREVSRLDAELAKAEALAAQARKQQSENKKGTTEVTADARKDHFSCSKNKCSVK